MVNCRPLDKYRYKRKSSKLFSLFLQIIHLFFEYIFLTCQKISFQAKYLNGFQYLKRGKGGKEGSLNHIQDEGIKGLTFWWNPPKTYVCLHPYFLLFIPAVTGMLAPFTSFSTFVQVKKNSVFVTQNSISILVVSKFFLCLSEITSFFHF